MSDEPLIKATVHYGIKYLRPVEYRVRELPRKWWQIKRRFSIESDYCTIGPFVGERETADALWNLKSV